MTNVSATPSPERPKLQSSNWKNGPIERPTIEIARKTPEPTRPPETPVAPELRPTVETILPADKTAEQAAPSKKEGFLEEAIDGLRDKLRGKKAKPTTIPVVQDRVTVQIEQIMEQGLGDAFQELSAVEQQEFKLKGEDVARDIRDLLRSGHVKVKKIFQLVLEWLRMLPGINRFFLEQEAKIKTDKILALTYQEKQYQNGKKM